MNTFIDLQGASGATYRFRLWPEGAAHLPIAGNYIYVRKAGAGFKVVVAGLSNDLSTCRRGLEKSGPRAATHVYTRLNVSRATRNTEHDDIVVAYEPAIADEPAG